MLQWIEAAVKTMVIYYWMLPEQFFIQQKSGKDVELPIAPESDNLKICYLDLDLDRLIINLRIPFQSRYHGMEWSKVYQHNHLVKWTYYRNPEMIDQICRKEVVKLSRGMRFELASDDTWMWSDWARRGGVWGSHWKEQVSSDWFRECDYIVMKYYFRPPLVCPEW